MFKKGLYSNYTSNASLRLLSLCDWVIQCAVWTESSSSSRVRLFMMKNLFLALLSGGGFMYRSLTLADSNDLSSSFGISVESWTVGEEGFLTASPGRRVVTVGLG